MIKLPQVCWSRWTYILLIVGGTVLLTMYTGYRLDSVQLLFSGGIHRMQDVCIEPDPSGKKVEILAHWGMGNTIDLPRKVIVVYNSRKNETTKFKVGASENSHIDDWPITYQTGPPPSTHKYIEEYPAYFMINTCPGNMWHYLADSLSQLYWTMKTTKRLNSTIPNMVYFRQPMYELHKKANGSSFCFNPASFAPLLTSFSVRKDFDTYHKAADNICYQNAVFGQGRGSNNKEIAEYVTKKFDLHNLKCGDSPVVTILQRTYRQILNAEDLKTAAIKTGFHNTTIVSFDDKPFMDQMSYIACTDILVGVLGTGLQWTIFLRPGRALLEISWPKKGWGFLFSNSLKNFRGIQTFQLEASDVKLNLESFSHVCHAGRPFSDVEKSTLASKGPISRDYNQWKWADGIFNPEEFVSKLLEIKVKIGQ